MLAVAALSIEPLRTLKERDMAVMLCLRGVGALQAAGGMRCLGQAGGCFNAVPALSVRSVGSCKKCLEDMTLS